MPAQQIVDRLYAPLARSIIAMAIITFSAFTVKRPFTEKGHADVFRWHLTFLWVAMVNFVISAPIVGRVAKVGAQHILGTVLGGSFGYAIVKVASLGAPFDTGAWWMTISTLVAVFLSIVVFSWYFNIPDTSTMFLLACIILVFATESLKQTENFAYSRVSGMVTGVILMQILATVVYPKSATQEVIRNFRLVLNGLCKLNKVAWEHAVLHVQDFAETDGPAVVPGSYNDNPRRRDDKGYIRMPVGVCKGGACEMVQALVSARLETALMSVYKGLENAEEMMPFTRTERGIRIWRGRWIFIPHINCRNTPTLPEEELTNVAWSVRKCARILWTLHLTFQDGLDEGMLDVLKQQYPDELMRTLVESSQDVFEDMFDAFPNEKMVGEEGLSEFRGSVEALFAVGAHMRTRIIGHLKRFKDQAMSRQLKYNPDLRRMKARVKETSLPRASSGVIPPVTSAWGKLRRALSRASDGDGDFLRQMRNNFRLSRNERETDEDLKVPLLVNSGAKSFSGCIDNLSDEHLPYGTQDVESGLHRPVHSLRHVENGSHALIKTASVDSATSRTTSHTDLETIKEVADETKLEVALPDPPISVPSVDSEQGSADSPLPKKRVSSPTKSTTGSVALDRLPTRVQVVPEGLQSLEELEDTETGAGPVLNPQLFTLPRVSTMELKDFPETVEGYVSMIRWYSFQFLLEELSEEMEELHKNLDDLLGKIPDAGIQRF